MTTTAPDDLEKRLAALTAWREPAPGLWKSALAAASRKPPTSPWSLSGFWRSRPIAAALLLGVTVCLAGVIFLASQSDDRTRNYEVSRGFLDLKQLEPAMSVAPDANWEEKRMGLVSPDLILSDRNGSINGLGGNAGQSPHVHIVQDMDNDPSFRQSFTDRQVIRKATIELTTKDVRATFLKAGLLVSEAGGEYVQDSSQTGEGDSASASLTLRVAASRLPTVLNELRALGAVRSENQAGEDVTAQIVDIDAHLRNEQRVEQELLALIEQRKNAPLADLLQVRQQLNMVRLTIEQMGAQREKLGRLVSLATVLVIIHADAPVKNEAPKPSSIGTYFTGSVSNAWDRGLRVLADSVAWLVNVALGGAIFWTIAGIALLVVRDRFRRVKRLAAAP